MRGDWPPSSSPASKERSCYAVPAATSGHCATSIVPSRRRCVPRCRGTGERWSDPAGALSHYSERIHAPKHETFDLVAHTNTDPKGIVRAVDVYTVESWGLYMARPTPGRAQFHYMESWLLPSMGLRATVFHFNPGHELDQDYYLDVGRYTPGAHAWHAEDYYLDIIVRTGIGVELCDVDELLTAV